MLQLPLLRNLQQPMHPPWVLHNLGLTRCVVMREHLSGPQALLLCCG